MQKSRNVKILILILLISYLTNGCSIEKMILKYATKNLAPTNLSNEYYPYEKTVSKLMSLDTIINTNIEISLIEGINPLISPPVTYENKYYFAIKDTSYFILFVYDPINKFLNKTRLIIDTNDIKEDKITQIGEVVDLAINEKYLVIATNKFAFVFNRNNNNIYKYLYGFDLVTGKVNGIFIKEDMLYLIYLYYTPDAKEFGGSKIYKINLVEKDLMGISPIYFENMEFLVYKPNKYWAISPSGNYLLLANPLKLDFRILKLDNFNQLYAFKDAANPHWKDYRTYYYDSLFNENKRILNNDSSRLQPSTFLFKLQNDFDKNEGSKIVFVDFIDDSTFWVTFTHPEPKKKKEFVSFCDIWKLDYKKNEWVKIESGLIDALPYAKTIANKENFYLLSSVFFPSFSNKYIANFHISAPMEIMLPSSTDTYEKLFKKRDNFFSENDLFWQLYIYKRK